MARVMQFVPAQLTPLAGIETPHTTFAMGTSFSDGASGAVLFCGKDGVRAVRFMSGLLFKVTHCD